MVRERVDSRLVASVFGLIVAALRSESQRLAWILRIRECVVLRGREVRA